MLLSGLQSHVSGLTFHTPVAIVRRASALRRDHRRSKRALGRAARPKGLALVRLLHAAQHQPADTLRRLLRRVLAQLKSQFRIKPRIGGAQPQPAAWNLAHTTPFAVYHLEHLADQLLRRPVPLAAHRAT